MRGGMLWRAEGNGGVMKDITDTMKKGRKIMAECENRADEGLGQGRFWIIRLD